MINEKNMINIKVLSSSNLEFLDEIINLSREAVDYLSSQKWCHKIIDGWFAVGWGYIMTAFFFRFDPIGEGVPDNVWIIVGDLPSAYIDAIDNTNGVMAVEAYVIEMQKWVDSVKLGTSIDNLIPVNVPPTKEFANMLEERLQILREEILLPN